MANEVVVLDPSEVATARTELDISSGAIRIMGEAGIDWGDSEIVAYMAEQQRGEAPVDYRIPNRKINIPLKLSTSGTVSFDQARQKLQSKVARLQQEGGWIKRVTNTAGTVFADVVNASLHLPHSWMAEHRSVEIEATLALEAIPDFYGAEITQADHTETTATELVFTETSLKGNYPARVRLVVDEDQGVDQLGLIWSFRSRYYSSATTAATKYEAESLQALDTARILALSGASGGTAVTHGTISTNWTPVVGTNMGGTAYLTHTGTNRIYARVYSTSGTTVQTRFVWDVGDLTNPVENSAWRVPGASNFYIADLGEVRLDPVPIGTHRWGGQIQARGDVGSESVSIDKVWIVNSDEGMGAITAPLGVASGPLTYAARSEFNTESGAVTGDTPVVGGVWTVVTNSDTDDFNVAGGVMTRTAVSDTGTIGVASLPGGRAITVGTTAYTNVAAQIDFKTTLVNVGITQGLMARWTDASNYTIVLVHTGGPTIYVGGLSGGVAMTNVAFPLGAFAANTMYTLKVTISVTGSLVVYFGLQGGPLQAIGTVTNSIYATGATQASGRVGIYDMNSLASAATRTYDNFSLWTPTPDAAVFASRSAQLCWNGHYRQDSGGTAYGPVSQVIGDLPRVPPAGLEGRTAEVFVKASRGDLNQLPDSGIDDISARLNYRPSWLFIPE